MSWYDEVRHFRGGYGRDYYEPRTAAFAGPGLFSPGILGGAGYVNWRERARGSGPPGGGPRPRYGYDYGYARRQRRPRYDRGWRRW